jgi:hypothetical protein
MSEKNPIRIYVTHAFASHSDYHRVFEYLEALPNFFYRNCSVPDHLPTVGGKEALKEEYRTQLKTAEVVVVLCSLYTENEYWTVYQMDAALRHGGADSSSHSFGGRSRKDTSLP